jgi:hypothetical protein
MDRPKLEVADILRHYGEAYRKEHAASLSTAQRRVMSAIELCRTAALGGHLERCDQCGHERNCFNSCLMESNFLWGVGRQKGMLRVASRPLNSPLRLGLQKREQFVRRAELALAKARRYNRFNGLELFGRISSNVDLRRGQIAVPQPQRDFPDVLRCL